MKNLLAFIYFWGLFMTFIYAQNQEPCFTESVHEIDESLTVLMPNAFTPNNDGVNDCFQLLYAGGVAEIDMNIYDELENTVFSTTDPTEFFCLNIEEDTHYNVDIDITSILGNTDTACIDLYALLYDESSNCIPHSCDTLKFSDMGNFDIYGFFNPTNEVCCFEGTPNQDIDRHLSVKLYPNPAHEQLFFTPDHALNNGSIQLYSINGELIKNQPYIPNEPLLLNDVKSGMYCLILEGNEGRLVRKIIID